MKNKIFLITIFALLLAGCHSGHKHKETDEHEEHDQHEQEEAGEHEGHEHEEAGEHDEHEHGETKIQLTAYSAEFELFAEADAFVVGETSNILSHFSNLPDFTALEKGSVTIRLIIDGKETSQILDKPTRKGIYSFNIKPETDGTGVLMFEIKTEKDNFKLSVPNITVYHCDHDIVEVEEASKVNTTVFTKEQSWKIDFATQLPKTEPFGQVIKTAAQVQSSQGDEVLVSAKTNGFVMLSADNVLEGKSVSKGRVLFSISGAGLANNNSAVQFKEAQNNFKRAESDYQRLKELAKDKIASEKDLLNAKNKYDNAKALFDNLNKNFSSSGQKIISPMKGFVKQLLVKNGQYVESGQPIVSISQNKTLLLNADVQQKYVSVLGSINSANIRTLHDDKTYTLEELNGKVLSFGRNTNDDNYLIPISLEIDNKGSFFPGSFVELYLKTITNAQALTIPNSALLEEQGNFFAFVQITPELFEKREIKIGATDGLKTEILKGIAQNERIVTKGAIIIKLAQATGTLDAHSGHVH